MTEEQFLARLQLRAAELSLRLAPTDFDRAVARLMRARAAKAVRSSLNVEKPLPMLLRLQAG